MGILLVAALPEETAAFDGDIEVLHLGVGKVQAAAALAAHLQAAGPRPDLVVNVGTAGGLHGQAIGTVLEVAAVLQHDFDPDAVAGFLGRPVAGGPLWTDAPPSATATLATGDHLVLDPDARDRLADRADVVDMEGYAVVALCRASGIPVRVFKAVSDGADDGAVVDWHAALARCSAALAARLTAEGLPIGATTHDG